MSKFKPGMLVEYNSSLDRKIMLILSYNEKNKPSANYYQYLNIETLKVGQFDVTSQVEERSHEMTQFKCVP